MREADVSCVWRENPGKDIESVRASLEHEQPETLIEKAGDLRDVGHGRRIRYSRKTFPSLTKLCRDVSHYCTFAHPPRRGERWLAPGTQRRALDRAHVNGLVRNHDWRSGTAGKVHRQRTTLYEGPERSRA